MHGDSSGEEIPPVVANGPLVFTFLGTNYTRKSGVVYASYWPYHVAVAHPGEKRFLNELGRSNVFPNTCSVSQLENQAKTERIVSLSCEAPDGAHECGHQF